MKGKLAEWGLMLMLLFAQNSVVTGVATTTVADTVYRADGTAATGTVVVSWPGFTTSTGANVPAGSTSATIGANGLLSVSLVPNAGSNPMGSYYTVVYHLDDGSVTKEYWVVPVSAAPVKVSSIRSTVLPASVALQTASKSYVDTAIAAAQLGHPLDSSTPYVLKTGDTMTGPLILSGDPTAPLQASDKEYVDTQVAGLAAGENGKVSLNPQGTQVVAQPAGTDLEVNRLNGTEYASQFQTGAGKNGIANAAASPDCAGGCDIKAEQTYGSTEQAAPATWNNGTQLNDKRGGLTRESHYNPQNVQNPGLAAGHTIDVQSTEPASQLKALGADNPFSVGLEVTHEGLAGGSNEYPKLIQGTVPYFKTTYNAMNITGTYNTPGQHVLVPQSQNCYAVGDCLMGSLFMTYSGGFRDDADEGAHPFDFVVEEDSGVFTGSCAGGCATGATTVQVAATAGNGTQGEGRFLMDVNPAKTIASGVLVGGANSGRAPSAQFQGTTFPVSVFLQTAATVPSQANNIMPGTVTVPIVTGGAPAGFATNTAALPTASGVACVADAAEPDGRPINFETAAYTVVDGSDVQLTLKRPHANGATLAVGGLCGYGLEQKVDTIGAIRQVFPVIGSTSATTLVYAGSQTSIVGISGLQSGFTNLSLPLTTLTRTNGVVTANIGGGTSLDVNGLALTISGVTDPSYNGTFAVTTTSSSVLTYTQAGAADSTTTGGTATYLTGAYGLYPMAEVTGVFNAATRAVDGQLQLAANTVPWAAGDAVEEPHYYQAKVAADTEQITQYMPRPSTSQSAGILYGGNNSVGLTGWAITNGVSATAYQGNGGTYSAPEAGMQVAGVWRYGLELEAGEDALIKVHCNSHGCDRYDSAYDLFQMDTSVGVDRFHYTPQTSTLTLSLRGSNYTFNPQSFTAGTINVGTLNATTVNGQFTGTVAASSLPVFGGSGATHGAGAVPDPGATGGTTRYLREDGTWATVSSLTGGAGTSAATSSGLSSLPQRANLLGEYLLTEGAGTVAHDTSGLGNHGTIVGSPTWEGGTDLDFRAAQGQYIQLPAGLNGAKAWQFAIYSPPFGYQGGAPAPLYAGLPGNQTILCGTDQAHLCLINSSIFSPKSMRFFAITTDHTEPTEYLSAGWHVVTFLCGGSVNGLTQKTHVLYDGAEVGGYVQQGDVNTCPVATSGNYQIGGSNLYGETWFAGKIAAAWAWSSILSVQDGTAAANEALSFLRSKGVPVKYRSLAPVTPTIVAGLDSRTMGVGLSPTTVWPATMQLNDPSYTVVNLGAAGQTAFDACLMFDQSYALQVVPNSVPEITVLWGGVNDYSFQNSRQIANNLRCMVTKAKALGSRVVLATEISANGKDTNKNGLNAILRAEAYGWGVDNLAELATDPHIGADGASNNASCFPDGLHPGPSCEPYVTSILQNAVNDLIGSSETARHQTAAASYQEVAGDRFLDLTGTAAQTVLLPDCTGYSLTRQVVNLGATGATVQAVNGQVLLGSGALAGGARGVFLPVPNTSGSAGCSWERTQ